MLSVGEGSVLLEYDFQGKEEKSEKNADKYISSLWV